MTYGVGEVARPRMGCGPLFVFREFEDAVLIARYRRTLGIAPAAALNVRRTPLDMPAGWTDREQFTWWHECSDGTMVADAVVLLGPPVTMQMLARAVLEP